jgi:hypothetical protein
MEKGSKVPGEIDLSALAISVPQSSSFATSGGAGAKGPMVLLPGGIDLEAIAIRLPPRRYWRNPAKVQATSGPAETELGRLGSQTAGILGAVAQRLTAKSAGGPSWTPIYILNQ